MTHAPIQTRFARAIASPLEAPPDDVTSHALRVPRRRFDVYRNNVTVGLTGALGARFPVVERIVGAEFFLAMARLYIDGHKPRSPVLMEWGDDFADFIAGFAPAAELPYLPDVARLEAARTRAYHAADAAPARAAELAAIGPARIADLLVRLHPSVSIVCSDHPVVTIWAMNSGGGEPAPIDEWSGEDALVARPALEVVVTRLAPGQAVMLRALAEGRSLGAAAEAALAARPDFDLSQAMILLAGGDIVRAFALPAGEKE